ncbi:MAG: N-6 DNA methylase [Bacteroidales bacterium]|nr:N-6 DNA methylase [Bacteroidales bacterium]
MSNPIIKTYISEVNAQYITGYAREHSYRPALQALLTALLPKYQATNEPARIECGAPDFIITKGDAPMAFVECKDIGDPDLDGQRQHKEQFNRYKSSLGNIVFTDYLDFHLYVDGEFVDSVHIAEVKGGKVVAIESNEPLFLQLIDRLANAQPQKITSSAKLAVIMANKARLLADVIEQSVNADTDGTSELAGQMAAFKQILLHDLTNKTFADIYAQTICYGMFAARLHDDTPDTFSRLEAATLIPKTNPFLRQIFQSIAGFDLDDRIVWIVDDLVEAFRVTDMEKIMGNYGKDTQQTDPMMHFYEDFLRNYDPATKKSCGVYYTPQPVVNFIVRAVDHILKTDFHLPMGLADTSKVKVDRAIDGTTNKKSKDGKSHEMREYHKVQILDPATGTGTFAAQAIRQIYQNLCDMGMQGVWAEYVKTHLIPRLNGFELMMAPYAIAHLKLDMLLNSIGGIPTTNSTNQRLRIYLTNSLEEYNKDTGTLFAQWLATEANDANLVKRDTPVMVMIGNPPYSVSSNNSGTWITDLMNDYKKDLNERNIQPLSDDYIKFIRLGQHYVQKNGSGILAYISNNSFIDGMIHRQMRKSLLETFDKIYILDLHGNTRKKETCEDGSKDENVFDIMQGVSINIFVKSQEKHNGFAQVLHRDLYGIRKSKYEFLETHDLATLDWNLLQPQAPQYFFVPKDFSAQEEYEKGFKIDELFFNNVSGIKTSNDKLNVKDSVEEVQELINDAITLDEESFRIKRNTGADTRDWSVKRALADVRENIKSLTIAPYSYRPFDTKFIVYTGKTNGIVARPRFRSLKAMLSPLNFALCTIRINRDYNFAIWVTDKIADKTLLSSKDDINIFPLYNPAEGGSIFGENENDLIPNFNKEIVQKIEIALGETLKPQELFDYVYGVLHTQSYRIKYREFLKIDFPRIPYPTSKDEFDRIANIGTQLRKLHLMESVPSMPDIAQFTTSGDNLVEKLVYQNGSVYFNATQCFSNVPELAWNFYVGGYQPAQKWLKDRKGRNLTFDDILHYRNIIIVLLETDRLMKELDNQ